MSRDSIKGITLLFLIWLLRPKGEATVTLNYIPPTPSGQPAVFDSEAGVWLDPGTGQFLNPDTGVWQSPAPYGTVQNPNTRLFTTPYLNY